MPAFLKSRLAVLPGLLFVLGAATPASAERPPHVELLGNRGCLLVFDMSTHVNPSAMFEYIREHSEEFVGEPHQNIVRWLANFPEFQGNVGALIRRNCRTFTIEISQAPGTGEMPPISRDRA